MTDDIIAIIACCILGLLAHGSRSQRWLEWVIRVTICVFIGGECLYILNAEPTAQMTTNPWGYSLLVGCAALSGVLLFEPGRKLFSLLFTFIEQIVAGRVLLALFGKLIAPVPVTLASGSVLSGASSSLESVRSGAENHPVSDVVSHSAATEAAPPGLSEAVSAEQANAAGLANSPELSESGSAGEPPASSAADSVSESSKFESKPAPGETAGASPEMSPGSGGNADLAGGLENTNDSDDTASPGQQNPSVTTWVMQKISFEKAFFAERIFVPSSIPHMNALWIYITVVAFLLTHTEMGTGFQMPSIMIPLPVSLDQLFSYNFLGLIMLSACGVGILVTRKPMETLRRLGIVKPTLAQVFIGIAGIFVTFAYDYLWSTYTHGQEGLGYADKISHYNEGAFNPSASASSAGMLASATGICAGIGEEILSRGALQPVLGILPSAFLHGVLHAQFSHAPILILQVFGWSTIMGIIRRYTNTTTTIITHVGFNFISTFLFAFNP